MESKVPFRRIVAYAIGGGWGHEAPQPGTIPVSVIRGTDFSKIASGDLSEIPRRYEVASKVERRKLRPGDIILEISGGSRTSNQTTGRSLFVTKEVLEELGEPVIPASFCKLVRIDESVVLPRYAYYALQEMYLSGRAALYENHSTGISNFQFEYFLDHELVYLPDISEQRAIVHILGSLDDKIELYCRMNKTLEAMARAFFKSWFVDYDPVIDNALKVGKPIPDELLEKAERRREMLDRAQLEGRSAGLPDHLAQLFPDEFEDSELGWIPKGWKLRGLDEIANYQNGLVLQKYPPEGKDSLPVIKIAQLRRGNMKGADHVCSNIPNEYVVEDGDVLFAWSGSLMVDIWCGGRGALNQHIFKVTSTQYPKWFYYYWLKHYLPIFQGIAADKATTMGHIQRHHLSEVKVIVPPPVLLEQMNRFLSPILDKIVYNRIEVRTLASIRDVLLPKLISGELRVKDLKRFLEGNENYAITDWSTCLGRDTK